MDMYAWFEVVLGVAAIITGWFMRKTEAAKGQQGRSQGTWLMIGGAVPLIMGLLDLLQG